MRTFSWFCFWLLLFSTIVFGAPYLIQKGGSAYIRDQIRQLGLEQAAIDTIRIGKTGFTFQNIRLDKGGTNTIQEINGTYDLWALIKGKRQLDSITIKGIVLEGTLNRETPEAPLGLTFPFWPERFTLNTLTNREEIAAGFTVPQLPFKSLQLEDALIRIQTDAEPLTFALQGNMSDVASPERILSGAFTAEATDRALNFKTEGKAALSVATQSLEAQFRIDPQSFDIATFQSQYGGLAPDILQKGTVDIVGDISVRKEKDGPLTVLGPLQIDLKNLSGQTDDIALNQMNGGFTLTNLLPELSGKIENVRIATLTSADTTFSTIRAHGHISGVIADPVFVVKDVSANVYDGTVSTPQVTYSLKNGLGQNVRLKFTRFDLAQLIRLLDIEGLRGQGKFSGEMTVSRSGKILLIDQGHVANLENGYISYLPDAYPDALAGDDLRLQTVRDALTDFRFHDLQADISGPVSGDLNVSLRAKGTNKKLFDERPIHFNLNIEGPLAPLAKSFFNPLSLRGEGNEE